MRRASVAWLAVIVDDRGEERAVEEEEELLMVGDGEEEDEEEEEEERRGSCDSGRKRKESEAGVSISKWRRRGRWEVGRPRIMGVVIGIFPGCCGFVGWAEMGC